MNQNSNNNDQRGILEEGIFSYQSGKDEKVLIFWKHKQVMILKGKKASKFLAKIQNQSEFEAQLTMAKITGNFKRGNERAKS